MKGICIQAKLGRKALFNGCRRLKHLPCTSRQVNQQVLHVLLSKLPGDTTMSRSGETKLVGLSPRPCPTTTRSPPCNALSALPPPRMYLQKGSVAWCLSVLRCAEENLHAHDRPTGPRGTVTIYDLNLRENDGSTEIQGTFRVARVYRPARLRSPQPSFIGWDLRTAFVSVREQRG